MMRKHFLVSAAACLIMASGLAYAQSPTEPKKDEPKKERLERSQPAKAGESRSEAKPQEKTRERSEAGTEQRNPRQAGEEHNKAATSSVRGGSPNSKEAEQNRARGESAKPNEHVEESRPGNRQEGNKPSSTSQTEKSAKEKSTEKSTQEPKKSKSGAASNESSQRQRGEASKSSLAPSQQSSTQTNKPAAASEADKNKTSNEAQRNGRSGSPSSSSTAAADQRQLPKDKEVRISETIRHRELAPPERNLNVSIDVGVAIPERVRLRRLPPEVVSIEPEYRDYDYFTTDDDIVIVQPGTRRIVSRVPLDVSRARAEMAGSTTVTANASGGQASPCQIMRRDASGQLSEASSSTTVGSSAQNRHSIAVTVQTDDQRSTAPIALEAQAGQIVVASQGPGDCRVTIEPETSK